MTPRSLSLALLAASTAASAQTPPSAEHAELPRVALSEAVRRAVSQNPTARVADGEVRRADALIEESRAAWLPTVSANATYLRLDHDRVLNGNVISAADQLAMNLTVSVPIAAPQRWAQWSHTRDNAATARAGAVEARWQVASATARAWLTVLAQHRGLEVLQRSRDTARAHQDFAHARFAGGLGGRVDEVRAAQVVAQTEAQLSASRSALTRSREALGVLVAADGPADVDEASVVTPPPAEDDALGSVLAQRPDLRTARARVDAAERVLRDNWVDYLPSLFGVFQPFYQNPPTLTQPLTGWQAQLVLSVPLYDGGLRYGAARERRALADEARATFEGAARQARADVRAAFEAIRRADEALTSARSSSALATETLTLTQTAYRAGAGTNIEVIDAERSARDAESAVVVAEDAARQARLDALLAAGRLP